MRGASIIVLTRRFWGNYRQWALRRRRCFAVGRGQLGADESFCRIRMVMIGYWSKRTPRQRSHRTLENNSLVVSLALSLRLDTIVAYRLSFVALDSSFSTC